MSPMKSTISSLKGRSFLKTNRLIPSVLAVFIVLVLLFLRCLLNPQNLSHLNPLALAWQI